VDDQPRGKTQLPRLSIETAILLATMLAGLAGQWAVMGAQINDLRVQIVDERADAREMRGTIYKLDNRLSVLESQYTYLKDAVLDLRRQGRSSIGPSP
jgi:hypothetical protein